MREIVVLSAEESRREELRQRLAREGVTSELGYRLAGLTEGEGCFSISRMTNGSWRCAFIIKLRSDDRPLLDDLAAATGLGRVRLEAPPSRYHPCARWEVSRKGDCQRLADVFTAYPLRSKKRRDAELWIAAVDAWATIYKHERADWSEIAMLAERLRATRVFVAPFADKPDDERRGGQR